MRTEEQRDGDIHLIKYFWEEKGDLERWMQWEELKHEYPDIAHAWETYKHAKRIVDVFVKNL